jgi:hypothetical protein
MLRRILLSGESRLWPAYSKLDYNIADEEGHTVDSVPFFSYLAHEGARNYSALIAKW